MTAARTTDGGGEDGFRAHMRRAGSLVAERRLPEAESELVRALDVAPGELRALKLLALVRFRLGRFAEARESYRAVAQAAPEDATARLNLGLIALKLEWFAEAVQELEAAVRLRADDQRTLGYLGYAYARLGRSSDAADTFRRAGQPDLAAELEGRSGPSPTVPGPAGLAEAVVPARPREGEITREFGRSRTEVTQVEAPGAAPRTVVAEQVTGVPAGGTSLSLTSFTIGRLISPDDAPPAAEWLAEGIYRLAVRDEAHVSADALLAADGEVSLERAQRRQRGRLSESPLGGPSGRQFFRASGGGEVWLAASRRRGAITALTLEDDVLYLREERVLAFGGELVWEWGRVPLGGLGLLQFRGSGRVLVDWGGADVVALRIAEPRRLVVPLARLFGWIGRVVVHGLLAAERDTARVACEGEGVLLIARHGHAGEPVHERPQPGHDGPDPAHSAGPAAHR